MYVYITPRQEQQQWRKSRQGRRWKVLAESCPKNTVVAHRARCGGTGPSNYEHRVWAACVVTRLQESGFIRTEKRVPERCVHLAPPSRPHTTRRALTAVLCLRPVVGRRNKHTSTDPHPHGLPTLGKLNTGHVEQPASVAFLLNEVLSCFL